MYVRPHHVRVLAASQLRLLLGGGRGARYLALFGFVGFIVAFAVIHPVAAWVEGSADGDPSALADRVAPLVAWWIDAEASTDPRIVSLLYQRPAVLSAIFVVLTGFMPVIASVAAGNHLALEISRHELRLLALRSPRSSILASRFLASVGLLSLASLLLTIALVIYAAILWPSVSMAAALSSGATGWFALTLVSMPYVGLSILVSVWVPIPAATRTVTLVIASSIPILLSRLAREFDIAGLVYADPWAWKYHALAPPPGQEMVTLFVWMGFTAVPLSIAAWLFQRRSL